MLALILYTSERDNHEITHELEWVCPTDWDVPAIIRCFIRRHSPTWRLVSCTPLEAKRLPPATGSKTAPAGSSAPCGERPRPVHC